MHILHRYPNNNTVFEKRQAAVRHTYLQDKEKGVAPEYNSLIFYQMSGKRDSNSRPSAWEADALPTELFPRDVSANIGFFFFPTKYSSRKRIGKDARHPRIASNGDKNSATERNSPPSESFSRESFPPLPSLRPPLQDTRLQRTVHPRINPSSARRGKPPEALPHCPPAACASCPSSVFRAVCACG